MLPEYILKEERSDNFSLLFVSGVISALGGFIAASILFPSESSVLAVIFASLPLVYPLTTKFLEDEDGGSESYVEEVSIYGSLFAGQALGFTLISLLRPEALSLQAQAAGITGRATGPGLFLSVLSNNLMVFTGILALSAIIGSAGAFILVWNASVLGEFFGHLLSQLSGLEVLTGNSEAATPVAYVPHATLEIAGFITAGILGTLISASVYREHFDKNLWMEYTVTAFLGVSLILTGAGLESGALLIFFIGLMFVSLCFAYLIFYGENMRFI
jgi:uncharacterized membrane protein SpoIIM required for sporulation